MAFIIIFVLFLFWLCNKGKSTGTTPTGSAKSNNSSNTNASLISSCVEKLLFLEETSICVSQKIVTNNSLWASGYRGSGWIRSSGGGADRGYVEFSAQFLCNPNLDIVAIVGMEKAVKFTSNSRITQTDHSICVEWSENVSTEEGKQVILQVASKLKQLYPHFPFAVDIDPQYGGEIDLTID